MNQDTLEKLKESFEYRARTSETGYVYFEDLIAVINALLEEPNQQ